MKIHLFFCKALLILLFFITSSTWSDEPEAKSHTTLSILLDEVSYTEPEAIEIIKHKYLEFIKYADGRTIEESLTFGDELIEIGEIIGMVTLAEVVHGIFFCLIATHINFDFFINPEPSSIAQMSMNSYPFIFQLASPTLFSMLWGTMVNFWLGVTVGIPSVITARSGSDSVKTTWKDLLYPTEKLQGAKLLITVTSGSLTYLKSRNSWNSVKRMFLKYYLLSFLEYIAIPAIAYYSRTEETIIVKSQCISFTADVLELFKKNPENTHIQELVRFHLNSPFGNCGYEKP